MGRVIKHELIRSMTAYFIIGLFIFILTGIFCTQVGIKKYNAEIKLADEFSEVEQKKVQRYINYVQYGIYGFRRLLVSSPVIALFYNSTTLSDLQAFIDNGVRLKFSKPEVGKNLFDKPTGGSLDFSWFIMVIGSILVLPFGFFSIRNEKYLEFLSGYGSNFTIYTGVIFARIILVIMSLFLTILAVYFQFLINGINLTTTEISSLLTLFLTSALLMVFSLMLAAVFGAINNLVKGSILLVFCWVILIMLWPEILNIIFSNRAASTMKSRYQHEIQKLTLLMDFERIALDRTRRYKTIEEKKGSDREMAEHWWDEEFKKVEKLEDEMMLKTRDNAEKFQFWSIFNPASFYKSVNNELSSKGYNSYLSFHGDNQKIQKGFLRFYLNKRFYEKYSKVIAYLSKGENVVQAKTSLPKYFYPGLTVSAFYIIILFCIEYICFKRRLYHKPEFKGRYDLVDLKLETGKIMNVTSYKDDLAHQIINAFLGKIKKGFNGKISIDGKSIVNDEKEDCVIIPGHDQMPGDIQAGAFLTFIGKMSKAPKEKINQLKKAHQNILKKRFYKLEPHQKASLLLAAAELKQSKTYIFRNFCTGIPTNKTYDLMERMKALKERGALVLDILKDNLYYMEVDFYVSIIFEEKVAKYISTSDLKKLQEQEEEELD